MDCKDNDLFLIKQIIIEFFMSKTITTFRKDLRTMKIGDEFEYGAKLHKGYLATASFLKNGNGEGEWNCAKRVKVLTDEDGKKFKHVYYSAIRKS